jgi:hypothetical protein
MSQLQGTFKLVYRGMDGYDLLFDAADGKRSVSSLEGAINVVEKVLGRPLTAGEKQTLAIGNGLVASFPSERYGTYF